MKKKVMILIIILLVVLVGGIGIFKLTRGKENSTPKKETDEKCFKFDRTKNEITSYDISCGKKVVIPSEIDGVKVKTLGNNSFKELGLTSVSIPEGIEIIGINTFEGNELKEVILPNSVKTIRPFAFENNKISKLKLGNNITSLDREAFSNNQLKDEDAFLYMRMGSEIDTTTLVGYAGANRKKVVIPDGVTTIYSSALANNEIKEIVLPESVQRIESDAFVGNKIEKITLPSSVMMVSDNVFDESVKTIIAKGKKSIEDFDSFGRQYFYDPYRMEEEGMETTEITDVIKFEEK